jgi:hypothetical protein
MPRTRRRASADQFVIVVGWASADHFINIAVIPAKAGTALDLVGWASAHPFINIAVIPAKAGTYF